MLSGRLRMDDFAERGVGFEGPVLSFIRCLFANFGEFEAFVGRFVPG